MVTYVCESSRLEERKSTRSQTSRATKAKTIEGRSGLCCLCTTLLQPHVPSKPGRSMIRKLLILSNVVPFVAGFSPVFPASHRSPGDHCFLGIQHHSGTTASDRHSRSTASHKRPRCGKSPFMAVKEDIIFEAIDELFPPQSLDQRIALSRKDGYWPYISNGEDPPEQFVYGEFDVSFLSKILRRSKEYLPQNQDFDEWVFCDLGSGTGRLVLTAAALFPWKACRGIELLQGIHQQAVEKLESCNESSPRKSPANRASASTAELRSSSSILKEYKEFTQTDTGVWLNDLQSKFDTDENENDELPKMSEELPSEEPGSGEEFDDFAQVDKNLTSPTKLYSLQHPSTGERLPLAPIEFCCGSFTDPYEFFGDANIIFAFSSCLPYPIRVQLARSLGRQCQQGTVVITTEYQLPTGGVVEPSEEDPDLPHGEYELELLETMTGENECTGGLSTVYIQRVTTSLGDGKRRNPPVLSKAEMAYRAIKATGNPKHSRDFLRRVSNEMVFAGFPESWLPNIRDY